MALTYQDLLEVQDIDKDRMQFVLKAIRQHQQSDMYKMAEIADQYYRKQNTTQAMPIEIISSPPYIIRGRPTKQARAVVRSKAFTIADGVTHPCAHARSGPRRVSSSLPRLKSK